MAIVNTKKKSIVYVNFAPYDNAGRILDYLTDNFSIVLHFSFDHLRLKKGRRSKLTLYKDGKLLFSKNLIWLRTYPFFLFPSLPFVALAIILQTFWYVLKFRIQLGKFDYFLTVNAFTAWIGNTLRFLQLVKKTIYWVWDYFPPNYPDIRLRLARQVYWRFDKPSRDYSNVVVYLNKHLESVRQEKTKSKKTSIIPIGTNPTKHTTDAKNSIIIGHLGMLKHGQGLDLVFDNLKELKELFPKIKLEVVGSGPEEDHFKERAKKFPGLVKFYGYVETDDDVDNIMRNWSIGIATYMPIEWSEHYWTDPSKIKAYLNQGLPVITTNVPEFAKEINKSKAGIIVDYYNNREFCNAVTKIMRERKSYVKNALKLAEKYNYKTLYSKIFI